MLFLVGKCFLPAEAFKETFNPSRPVLTRPIPP